MQTPVYLDNSATTPVDPRVAEKMMQCLTKDGNFGNPASRSHLFGWRAEEAVEDARLQVAELIEADAREIVWTSKPLPKTMWFISLANASKNTSYLSSGTKIRFAAKQSCPAV